MSVDQKVQTANLIMKIGHFPSEHRRLLWILSCGAEQSRKSNPGYYWINAHNNTMNDSLDGFNSEDIVRPLLESYKYMPDPYSEQIQLDLKRTFTDDEDFMN